MISIIIITYNSKDFLQEFFKSLKLAINNDFELVIWDNNSDDESHKYINYYLKYYDYKKFHVIRSEINLGFAKAINESLKYCSYEHILLVNPDVIFLKDSLRSIVKFYLEVKPAIVGGKYLSYKRDGVPQKAAVNSVSFISAILELTNLKKIVPFQERLNKFWVKEKADSIEVVSVSGGFLIASREIIISLNGFNESYWLYLEDVDFCLRAQQIGYKTYYYPKARIKHYSGGSHKHLSRRHDEARWFQSRDIFFRMHFNLILNCVYLLISKVEKLILKLRK
ncbi:hypothetical protein A3C23_02600 [Candidatus Roizmanbacteria bacterium RIFCSPHIGHO2_02_FULL_37_13b]|uniref:Glycosyltransferase 2-like domain-containing protein n=1 Tax=Candidatus Roizmanbacteria bacterium RIFCSPLOWO2_02_FULL_36_11 TaxID=1802071 RepID=A0A1F7JG22_9BACT|nr:MAG: hypothetical protein A3C23_02600 [Candidatus Roizmanbacteria bacterium RIFCSPHIGHO2_02_FULL_37_13b]OGK54563.1 MAG: hypothetical protein A3H78_01610 [Candidatus Roizmanbacteria bacterium RIFCSPLOWO2_02_FULL_36_11]